MAEFVVTYSGRLPNELQQCIIETYLHDALASARPGVRGISIFRKLVSLTYILGHDNCLYALDQILAPMRKDEEEL